MLKNSLFLIILVWCSLITVPAQTPTLTPSSDNENDVVRISTTLIQIDATVTDKKGKIVKDLKPEDFEVYENGKKQNISTFSFVNTKTESDIAQSAEPKQNNQKNTVSAPPVKIKPEQIKRTYAIIVDDLSGSLSFTSSYLVKQAVKKFIKDQMQEGDLVALIRTSGGIGALQSFTSDKRQLLFAADKIRWTFGQRIGTFDPLISIRGTDKGSDQEKYEKTDEFLNSVEDFRRDSTSLGSLGAIKYIINGMKDLPGRKSVMLLSEGFNLYNTTLTSGMSSQAFKDKTIDPNTFSALRILTELANRESITFYPIDPRGLDEPSMRAEDDTSDLNLRANANAVEKIIQRRNGSLRDSQDSLAYIAQQTGGMAYYNQNDINIGMQRVLNDQAGYYLLGYQPDEETFDAQKSKFNKLVIKIKNPDLRVRYRTGFFGVTDEKVRQIRQTPQQQLNTALTSPFGASEVNLDLYSIAVADDKNKNSIRSFVYIDTKNLTATLSGDNYQGNYELVAIAYGDNGTVVDQAMKSYKFQFDKKFYQQFLDKGLIYDLTLPLKKSGAYQLRIAVRDVNSGKVGSASQFVEVPDTGKNKLTVSNLIVKNYTLPEWKKVSANQFGDSETANFFRDTTLRQFKRGTVLSYAYVIYNAKVDAIQSQQLKIQAKLYYQGKLLLQSEPQPYKPQSQSNLRKIEVLDSITLGSDLKSGEYALQLIISENEKRNVAQSIDFEIIE